MKMKPVLLRPKPSRTSRKSLNDGLDRKTFGSYIFYINACKRARSLRVRGCEEQKRSFIFCCIMPLCPLAEHASLSMMGWLWLSWNSAFHRWTIATKAVPIIPVLYDRPFRARIKTDNGDCPLLRFKRLGTPKSIKNWSISGVEHERHHGGHTLVYTVIAS